MILSLLHLAAESGETTAEVAAHVGWFLHNAWLFPAIPFVSFLTILLFGKRMPHKGAEVGITALGICFVFAILTFGQWRSHVNESERESAAIGSHSALVVGESAAEAKVLAAEGGSETKSETKEVGEHVEERVAPVHRTWTWWQSGPLRFDVMRVLP